MMRRAIVACTLLMLMGCGSSGSESSQPATTEAPVTEAPTETAPVATEATTTTQPVTTTTEITEESAQEQYLELVKPANCALADYVTVEEAVGAFGPEEWPDVMPQLIPVIDGYAKSLVTFYEGLADAEWPEDAQTSIDDLIAETSDEAAKARTLADAETFDEYLSAPESSDSNAAGVVRAKLGLDSNLDSPVTAC